MSAENRTAQHSVRRRLSGFALPGILLVGILGAGCDSAEDPDLAPVELDRTSALDPLFAGFECKDCNVVILSLDTVRADYLPCYGFENDTAPRICEFIDDSLQFNHAYSPAPSTVPALTAIFGGSVIANEDAGEQLAHYERVTLLAERLAGLDYTTAGITDHRGFGDLEGVRPRSANLLRGFQSVVNIGGGKSVRMSAEVSDLALEWLDANHTEKFYLWVHYFDPHFNYMPPPELEGRFGFDAATCGRIRNGIDITEIRELEDDLTEREVECLSALHQAEIFDTDQHVGRVLARIDELGLSENTLVIFTTDHGEEFLERTRIGHEQTVYNELVRVPFAIRNPRHPARETVEEPISTVSLYPIILGAVSGSPIKLDPYVVSRTYLHTAVMRKNPDSTAGPPEAFAMVRGSSKIILKPRTDHLEIYDLLADLGERDDLSSAADPANLQGHLRRWLVENTAAAMQPSPESEQSFEETEERLKSLGYVR
jgi:hypothetical protein